MEYWLRHRVDEELADQIKTRDLHREN
jgi:hypothetical protein